MNNEISNQLIGAIDELHELIRSFPEPLVNEIPFEGSWTPAQVADHILMSQEGVLSMIQGKTESTDRPAGQYIKELEKVFMDFDLKMKSPDFIKPSEKPLDKTVLLARIGKSKLSWEKTLSSLDLNPVCLEFIFPGSPPYTRLEWTYFILFHTKRHNHQLSNISKRIRELS